MNNSSKIAKTVFIVMLFFLSAVFNIASQSFSPVICIAMCILCGVISYTSSVAISVGCVFVSYLLMLASIYVSNPGTEMFYHAFRVLLFICPSAMYIGFAIKKKYDFYTTYAGSVLIFVISFIIHLVKIVHFDKINIIQTYIRNPFNMLLGYDGYLSSIPFGANQEIQPETINLFIDAIASSVPSVIIIFSMVIIFIMLFAIKKVIGVINKDETFENIVPFSHLKLKRTTALCLFALYIISLFSYGIFGIVVGNILSVLLAMSVGCGFSVVEFYFKKAVKYTFLRIFIYITGFGFVALAISMITFINPVMILALVGMIDASRDFRKIDKFGFRILFK